MEREPITAPVKEGQELIVTIEMLGSKGDGIAKIERYTVFIPGTQVGQTVKIKVNKVLPKFAFAEVINE